MTTQSKNYVKNTTEPSEAVRKAIAEAKELPILDVGPYLAGVPGARSYWNSVRSSRSNTESSSRKSSTNG